MEPKPGNGHMVDRTPPRMDPVLERNRRPQVVLTILSADRYFVVLGSAYASRDPELIRRLWRPSYRAWFPAGKDDREATALRVVIDSVN